LQVDPARIEEGIASFREQGIPDIRQQGGKGARLLVDHRSGSSGPATPRPQSSRSPFTKTF